MNNIRIIVNVEIINDLHYRLKFYNAHSGLYFDDSNRTENELYKILLQKKISYYTFDKYISDDYLLYEILLSYWENEEISDQNIILEIENKITKSKNKEIDIPLSYNYQTIIALSSNVHNVPYSIMQELITKIDLKRISIHESHGSYGSGSFSIQILLGIVSKIGQVILSRVLNKLDNDYKNYPKLSTTVIKSFNFTKLYDNIRNYGESNIKEIFPIEMSSYNKDKYRIYFKNKDKLIEIICDKNSNILKLERK